MHNLDVIVIGGSAGATGPLKAILAALPADFAATIFVVVHVPTHSTGILVTVASAACALPVVQAEDGMAIKPGRVYLAKPNAHLILEPGKVRLGRGPRENMFRPAIDPLFRSAALAYGPRVIGVLLSGLMNDGASGLHAIKQCGGMTIVQDPADAIAGDMPRHGMEATTVDLCVPAAQIGDVLAELAMNPSGPALPIPPELQLEVDIAAGARINGQILRQIADPAALTCPACGGVLSEVMGAKPLRFRCQVGHAYTAEALADEQEGDIDEALRVALRIIEERAELVERMAEDGRRSGKGAVASMYAERAREYRTYSDTIRRAVLSGAARPEVVTGRKKA